MSDATSDATRRAVVLALLGAAMLAGCRGHRAGSKSPDSVDAVANEYVRLALALGERDTDSLDFAVTPQEWKDEARRAYLPLAQIETRARALRERDLSLPASEETKGRREFLAAQLGALAARAWMLQGKRQEFDAEAQSLFDVARLPDTYEAQRRELRAKVHALLPPATKAGEDDAQRYARYSAPFAIPPQKLAVVMRAALAQCRARTMEHFALPAGESIELELVRDKPWAAFSRYMGHGHSVIQLNADLPMTVDDALELACHEGYPGHHVFNTLRDAALVQEKLWPEAEVQLTFSPQSHVSEAAAAYAPELALSSADRVRIVREVLMPLAGVKARDVERMVALNALVRQLDSAEPGIVRDYVDGRLEFVRAEQALERESLMANSEALLLYVNEYRSYMLAYTDGPRRVAAEVGSGDARWKAYEGMMREMRWGLRGRIPSAAEAALPGGH